MYRSICVIDLPGFSNELLQHVPQPSRLGKWIANRKVARLVPPWPAVTCAVQATLTTGVDPSTHGIVCNGLPAFRSASDQKLVDAGNFASYRRDVSFWEQSNQLLDAPRFWNQRLKTALLFFQNSMPGFSGELRPAADIVITPKPEHGADGKMTSLLWTEPRDLQKKLFEQFGPFPLMNYWGPMAGIASSTWIARAAAWVWTNHRPQLQLTYVPHLDYDLQRFGPNSPQAKKAVQEVSSALEPLLDAVLEDGELVLLSEYSMGEVNHGVGLNRILREAGLLKLRQTPDGMLVDYPGSRAFAMVDHQIAHLYLQNESDRSAVNEVLRGLPVRPVEESMRIRHRRAGEIQVQTEAGAWLDYRWWSTETEAPLFARMVDIHRKPGYDPLELFFEPTSKTISQDAALVRGSHGRVQNAGLIIGDGVQATVLAARDFPVVLMRQAE